MTRGTLKPVNKMNQRYISPSKLKGGRTEENGLMKQNNCCIRVS